MSKWVAQKCVAEKPQTPKGVVSQCGGYSSPGYQGIRVPTKRGKLQMWRPQRAQVTKRPKKVWAQVNQWVLKVSQRLPPSSKFV